MAYGKTEEILLDYASSATLKAGNYVQTAPVQVSNNPGGTNGSLNNNEVAEFLAEDSEPPFTAPTGDEQALDDVKLVLDGGDPSSQWWRTSLRASLCTTPPAQRTVDSVTGQGGPGTRVYFSPTGYGGILEAFKVLLNPLPGEEPPDTMGRALIAAAVPRYAKRAVIMYTAGVNQDVTSQWLDRWVGHRYLNAEIDDLYSGFSLGGHVRFTNPFAPAGSRTIEFDVPVVQVRAANWGKLPGGPSSAVLPFRRYAIATQPTQGGQTAYDLTWTGASTTQVADQHQSMDFDYTQVTDEVIVVTGFQIRLLQMSSGASVATPTDLSLTAQNLRTQFVRISGWQPSPYLPKNGLPASDIDNPQLAGWTYPTRGQKQPPNFAVLRPLQGAYTYIAGNRWTAGFSDNGTAQAAYTVGANMAGTRFKCSNLQIH